jgi:hypothetical protein
MDFLRKLFGKKEKKVPLKQNPNKADTKGNKPKAQTASTKADSDKAPSDD